MSRQMSLTLLSTRRLQPEIMDQPELDPAEHTRALRGLERLNFASRVASRFWRELDRRARPSRGGSLRLLDIASGGGDVPLRLWRHARRHGVRLHVLGMDKSATACQYAARRAFRAQGDITFQQHNVVQQSLPGGF